MLSAAIDMMLFTQQMTVTNQIPLVMQKLCRQEALHQTLVITQTVKRRKGNTKGGKLIIRQQVSYYRRNMMKIMQYIRENRFRSKHKLTSSKTKITDRSVLP